MTDEPDPEEIPPLLEDCEIEVISDDPLVGLIHLETNSGTLTFGINRAVAEDVLSALIEFTRIDSTSQ